MVLLRRVYELYRYLDAMFCFGWLLCDDRCFASFGRVAAEVHASKLFVRGMVCARVWQGMRVTTILL